MGKKLEKIDSLEKELQNTAVWQNAQKAVQMQQELTPLKTEAEGLLSFKRELQELEELASLKDESLVPEIEGKISALKERLRKEELKVFLAGKYDQGNATLSIYAGAGGQDAQDWAAVLQRMYERYCQRKGFRTKILHQAFGEPSPEGEIGIKSVAMEVVGRHAYGVLKGENGVHRLVRISPFSAQKLRHTSFALVEVLPEFNKDIAKKIEIRPEDLRIDTFRASGPGGQYVNRRESAVRITHLATGITVSCQSERLQGQNRTKAMELLCARLYQLKSQEQKGEVAAIRQAQGGGVSASWGNQIRSYVLHPYKMVKDLRTKVETSDVEEVLDGNLDEFVEAEIKTK